MDRVRASISATLAEIEANPLRSLIDREEWREALAIVGRIERQLLATGIQGDRKWSPKKMEGAA